LFREKSTAGWSLISRANRLQIALAAPSWPCRRVWSAPRGLGAGPDDTPSRGARGPDRPGVARSLRAWRGVVGRFDRPMVVVVVIGGFDRIC
jgi:hypothetical protein